MAIRFPLRGETIQLDQLLKATGLCDSGAAAKAEVADGQVQVDGQVELRKRAQLRLGQVVAYAGETIELVAGESERESLRVKPRKAATPPPPPTKPHRKPPPKKKGPKQTPPKSKPPK